MINSDTNSDTSSDTNLDTDSDTNLDTDLVTNLDTNPVIDDSVVQGLSENQNFGLNLHFFSTFSPEVCIFGHLGRIRSRS